MSNAVQRYTGMPTSFNEALVIAKNFAESGLFSTERGAMTPTQVLVAVQAGAELGVPPYAAVTGIHVIKGKPTIGAGLLGSLVRDSGRYDYKILENTDDMCRIEFWGCRPMTGNKWERLGESKFSKQDAQRAGTQNMGKFPANMLLARAMSNGVKWFCPDVTKASVYVPGEIEDGVHTVDAPYVSIDPETPTEVTPQTPPPPPDNTGDWLKQGQLSSMVKAITGGNADTVIAKIPQYRISKGHRDTLNHAFEAAGLEYRVPENSSDPIQNVDAEVVNE